MKWGVCCALAFSLAVLSASVGSADQVTDIVNQFAQIGSGADTQAISLVVDSYDGLQGVGVDFAGLFSSIGIMFEGSASYILGSDQGYGSSIMASFLSGFLFRTGSLSLGAGIGAIASPLAFDGGVGVYSALLLGSFFLEVRVSYYFLQLSGSSDGTGAEAMLGAGFLI